jgi:DNA modification methylase
MNNPITLLHGDCLERLRELPDNSVDSVVTDPPYGLSFMGKRWDYDVPSVDVWAECLRVLKPGGHLLAFAGTRTQHRMAVRIEDAGFEIRDMIAWCYGSGFPKSLDVSKAIDRAAGAEREVTGTRSSFRPKANADRDPEGFQDRSNGHTTTPATDAAKQWDGWGTALKPALEPITVARKPLSGTVAENVQQHGTGALNVDGCRVGTEDMSCQFDRDWKQDGTFGNGKRASQGKQPPPGRWPANLIHDGSEEVVELFPVTGASKASNRGTMNTGCLAGECDTGPTRKEGTDGVRGHDDNGGSAARFFYCAKASKADRDEGNRHPTVKPTALMRYLCRLVTPPGGVVLDPFMGSGSTGKAAIAEGFRFIGCEREAEYVEIARARIAAAEKKAA